MQDYICTRLHKRQRANTLQPTKRFNCAKVAGFGANWIVGTPEKESPVAASNDEGIQRSKVHDLTPIAFRAVLTPILGCLRFSSVMGVKGYTKKRLWIG